MEVKLNIKHIISIVAGLCMFATATISFMEDSMINVVTKYCTVDVNARSNIRSIVNSKLTPNSIHISCSADEV